MTQYNFAIAPHFVIALPVNLANLPKTIEVEGNTLLVKDHFHVSLVCSAKIKEKFNVADPDFVEKVNKDFGDFTAQHEVQLIGFRDEYKFVEEDEKKAVVCMCDIENLHEFFDLLNKKYNLEVPYPPTHATIYTLQPNVGIFLTNEEDIERLTKPIANPIGEDLNAFVCPA